MIYFQVVISIQILLDPGLNIPELDGIRYEGRSFLYASLNLLASWRQLVLTMMDFGSNADRSNPASDLTLDNATYAMPDIKTLSDRSTIRCQKYAAIP